MSKLNHLLNAEKIIYVLNASEMGGDNVMKACQSIQWSLASHIENFITSIADTYTVGYLQNFGMYIEGVFR